MRIVTVSYHAYMQLHINLGSKLSLSRCRAKRNSTVVFTKDLQYSIVERSFFKISADYIRNSMFQVYNGFVLVLVLTALYLMSSQFGLNVFSRNKTETLEGMLNTVVSS